MQPECCDFWCFSCRHIFRGSERSLP
jgi:hypothetical protein